MSTTFSVGFVGVSRYSTSQPRAIAFSTASWSSVSQRSTSIRWRGRMSMNSWFVPPYVSFTQTTREPGLSSVNSVPETAAMPDAKPIACSAFSRSAIFRSNARTVGFVLRE